MQNNPPQNDQRSSSSPPPKPQRLLSRNSPYAANISAAGAARMQDLPQHPPHQRFSLTPQNAGMDFISSRDLTPQQHEPTQQQRPQPTTAAQLKPYVRQEHSQQPINTTYDSPSSSQVKVEQPVTPNTNSTSSSFQMAEQNNYVPSTSASRTSAPLSPTPRLAPSAASFISAALSSAQQTLKSSGLSTANMSPPTTPTNDRQSTHTSPGTSSYLQELPMAYYEQKFRSGSVGDTAKINGELNALFLQRLRDIDEHGQGDNDLKLVTYQEWVDMLLKVNESLISNMEQLELDVAERLEFLQRRVNLNCRHSQGNELMKCRKDIDTLMKIIQNGTNYNNEFDMRGMSLETITPAQIFGLPDHQLECLNAEEAELQMRNAADPESVHRNKLLAHVKALAIEVAEKHDEVRELKSQVVCMEDEIQKAQQKIQFKDDVIKELRSDLKRNAKHTSAELCLAMPPIYLDSPRSEASTLVSDGNQLMTCLDDTSSQYESLSHNEHVVKQKLKMLNDEVNELIEVNKQCSNQQMEKHRSRLSSILQKSESEKAAAYRKLDFMRRQLIDLETSGVSAVEGDCDSGIGSKNENDQDVKILESVRKRLRNLNETTCELKSRVQKFALENNELSTSLQSVKTFADRNSSTLKNVADLLCSMVGEFSYTDMYNNDNSQCGRNPFCEAIMDIKRSYEEREKQLLHTVGLKNKKIEELTQALIDHEKIFGQQQRQRLNISEGEDIDNITPPSSLSAQSQLIHRQQRQSPQ